MEIYIHIPFCKKKCDYCDFLSAPAAETVMRRYVDALKEEIRQFEAPRPVSTVFIGGGTPSILPGSWIGEIMETLRHKFRVLPDAEISIECNPGTADAGKLEEFRLAGINRLSLGLQSADDRDLRMLGRIHTWKQFLDIFRSARDAGFCNINVDLMSGLPEQTAGSWEETLKKVLALQPEHISAYSLIIEEGTPFYQRYHEDLVLREKGEEPSLLPSEEEERRMYHRTEKILAGAGYLRYEISNYAREGFDCRHNTGYWTREEYAGFGLGAASLLGNARLKNTEDLGAYLRRYLDKEKNAAQPEKEILSRSEEISEAMFLGLRLIRGVEIREVDRRYRTDIRDRYGKGIRQLKEQELLAEEDGCLRLTGRGLDLANLVMGAFV